MKKVYKEHLYWMGVLIPFSLLLSVLIHYIWQPSITENGSVLWLFWSFFTAFVIKIEHPPVRFEQPLTTGRKIVGWLSMLIFILCISVNPLTLLT